MSSHYQKAYFLLSVAEPHQLPSDEGIEVAIVGRSNAGKSSALNKLAHSKRLARVSKTPGRTQLVNVFMLDDRRRIIDLPGYGFAKVPLSAKKKWEVMVNAYVQDRACLKGLVLVMDIRHPMRDLDKQLLEYCEQRGLLVHILLNKADKLSKSAAANTLFKVKNELKDFSNTISVQLFSAHDGLGLKELHGVLDGWYGY